MVVLSGSMEPAIPTGGIVFTDTRQTAPCTGDIITYRLGETTVTHRVVRTEKGSYITRGDANDGEDASPVAPSQVVGTVVFCSSPAGIRCGIPAEKNCFLSASSGDRSGNDFFYNSTERRSAGENRAGRQYEKKYGENTAPCRRF